MHLLTKVNGYKINGTADSLKAGMLFSLLFRAIILDRGKQNLLTTYQKL